MTEPLERLANAHQAKLDAERAYEASLRDAREAGATLQAIADTVGVTRAGALYLLRKVGGAPQPVDPVAAQRARLAEIDGKWDTFVTSLVPAFMPTEQERKREQAYRNQHNAKAARQRAGVRRDGKRSSARATRKLAILPTVTVEARTRAEKYALELVQRRALVDVQVGKIASMLEEAEQLRATIQAADDSRVEFLGPDFH